MNVFLSVQVFGGFAESITVISIVTVGWQLGVVLRMKVLPDPPDGDPQLDDQTTSVDGVKVQPPNIWEVLLKVTV